MKRTAACFETARFPGSLRIPLNRRPSMPQTGATRARDGWKTSPTSLPTCCSGCGLSSASLHSDAFTEWRDSALRAERADRFAQVLTIGDEQVVKDDPVFSRKLPTQRHFRFI